MVEPPWSMMNWQGCLSYELRWTASGATPLMRHLGPTTYLCSCLAWLLFVSVHLPPPSATLCFEIEWKLGKASPTCFSQLPHSTPILPLDYKTQYGSKRMKAGELEGGGCLKFLVVLGEREETASLVPFTGWKEDCCCPWHS